jgi:DNA-binding NarL/FixJ family response regulator
VTAAIVRADIVTALQLGAQGIVLTPRELEIIGAVRNGDANNEIGVEFTISEKTVKHHLTLLAVHHKIGIQSPDPQPATTQTAQ